MALLLQEARPLRANTRVGRARFTQRAMCTRASADVLQEAATRFFPGRTFSFAPTSGGVNNVVQYLTLDDGERYVLRVYNNGQNTERVRYEHAVLQQLASKAGSSLSFQLPVALLSPRGLFFETLSTGDSAALFRLIPGVLPKNSCARAIGRAAGELTRAMALVDVSPLVSPTAPYWDLYKVHRSVTKDSFFETVAGAAFDGEREATDYVLGVLGQIERNIGEYKRMGLPQQLIHGDCHTDNVLVSSKDEDGVVTGVLDFEFAAFDYRAMELAISLSKYVSLDDPLPSLTAMLEGYATKMRLTDAEVAALPALISLRVISNCIYFVGRALGGEDSISSLTTRIGDYAKRVRWINANGEQMVRVLRSAYAQQV